MSIIKWDWPGNWLDYQYKTRAWVEDSMVKYFCDACGKEIEQGMEQRITLHFTASPRQSAGSTARRTAWAASRTAGESQKQPKLLLDPECAASLEMSFDELVKRFSEKQG